MASDTAYQWRYDDFQSSSTGPLLIYEAHVGMAQDAECVGTFREFTTRIIPRIVDAGYNVLQLMAIQEHPYYASFGYQVSSFFAPSCRFGTPEDLKEMIDTAHEAGY
jgi:1,4-alpha-glucan branching enzyme